MQSRWLFHSFFILFTLLNFASAGDDNDDGDNDNHKDDFPDSDVSNIQDTSLTFDPGWKHWPQDGPPPGMTSNVNYNSVSWCLTGSNLQFRFRGSAVRIWSLTSSLGGMMTCYVDGKAQTPVSMQGPNDQIQKALFQSTGLDTSRVTTLTCALSNPGGNRSINVVSIDVANYQDPNGSAPAPVNGQVTTTTTSTPSSTKMSASASNEFTSSENAAASSTLRSSTGTITSTFLTTNTFTTTQNGTTLTQTSTSSSLFTSTITVQYSPQGEVSPSNTQEKPNGNGNSRSRTSDNPSESPSGAANISSTKSKTGSIVGAVIAVILVIIAAIALLVWIRRRRRRRILQTLEAINPYFAGESETPFPPSTPTPRIEEPTPIMQQRLYNTRASIASGFKSLIPSSTRHQRDRLAPLGINRHELNNNSTVRWLEDNWSSTEGSVVHDDSDEEEEKEDATRRQTGRTAFEHLSSRRSVGGGEFGAYAT